jgi:hypothetical protein
VFPQALPGLAGAILGALVAPITYVPVSANSNSGWLSATDATRVAALGAVDGTYATTNTDGAVMSMRLG